MLENKLNANIFCKKPICSQIQKYGLDFKVNAITSDGKIQIYFPILSTLGLSTGAYEIAYSQ